MARCSVLAIAGLGAAIAACYAPTFDDGLPCSATSQCPAGQACDETANPPVCHAIGGGGDAGPDGPPAIDAIDGDVAADTDGDLVDDATDNCRVLANADQRDHDLDGIGDVCDNCPGIANPSQADTTEAAADGVGDACDPWPTLRDRIAVFDGFYDPLAAFWRVNGSATVTGGYLVPDAAAPFSDTSINHMSTFSTARRIAIEVVADVAAFDPANQYPSVKVALEFDSGGGTTDAYECGLSEDTVAAPPVRAIDLHVVKNDVYTFLDGDAVPSDSGFLFLRASYQRLDPGRGTLGCRGATPSTMRQPVATDIQLTVGTPGFYAYRARARFDYAVIYTDLP